MTKTRPDGCNRDGESIARSTPTRIFQRTQKGKMRLELGRERRVGERATSVIQGCSGHLGKGDE
jgi:hypothetical protein